MSLAGISLELLRMHIPWKHSWKEATFNRALWPCRALTVTISLLQILLYLSSITGE